MLSGRAGELSDETRAAAARLAGGDADRALFLTTEAGAEVRSRAESCARAARAGAADVDAWGSLLEGAERAGRESAERAAVRIAEELEQLPDGPERRRAMREGERDARRIERRGRTEALQLGLAVCGSWFRDLAAVAEGASELAFNSDRADELTSEADGLDPALPRRAVEHVLDARRRLDINVSEQLCLEALCFRLSQTFT
jgi:DNA polymerase-3 subunit delta'